MASVREGFFGFGFKVFFYLVFGLVLSDAILYFITDHTIGDSYYDALAILRMARHTTFALSVTLNAIVHLGALAVIFIASLLISNRITGPMYRFWNVARSVKDGDLTVEVNVRHGDVMRPQAEDFRMAISAMRKKIKSVKDVSLRLADRMDELDSAISTSDAGREEAGGIAEDMKADIGEIRDTLTFFKT